MANRLNSTPTTGNGDDGITPSPQKTRRSDVTGLFDTGVNLADTKSALRPSADVVYDAESLTRDVRSLGGNNFGRTVYVNSDAAGADTFTLSFECDVDNIPGYVKGTLDVDGVFTTSALNDDDSAATIQTAIRAALPGTDLTVVEGPGPDFYIIFDRYFWPRNYPRVTFNGTGCTATVTVVSDIDQDTLGTVLISARDGEISALGESQYVSPSDSIIRPTIGTITVTGGTDAVHKLAFSAGTDGGTWGAHYSAPPSPGLSPGVRGRATFDWDADPADVQAGLDTLMGANAPTVAWVTPLDMEINFVDWDTTDDAILTYDTTDASDSLEFATIDGLATAAEREAAIVAWVKTIDAFAGSTITATETTSKQEYDVVFHTGPVGLAVADFSLAVTGTTNEDATPDQNVALNSEAGISFTFENGDLAGRPVSVNTFYAVSDDLLTDGGVSEPGTYTETTAGVLGSISAAYTEQGSGDTILVAAVKDVGGASYGGTFDAATPVVIGSLPPGAYHLVARTVEDGRVSKAHSKAFTMTSS